MIAALLCRDITRNGSGIEGSYDLITCFRFLKNAEPDLRSAALRQLALRLKAPDSLLVVNIHGSNPFSYRFLLIPYHWLRAVFYGRKLKGYLTNREVGAVIKAAGLVVERVIGMGSSAEKFQSSSLGRCPYGSSVRWWASRYSKALGWIRFLPAVSLRRRNVGAMDVCKYW